MGLRSALRALLEPERAEAAASEREARSAGYETIAQCRDRERVSIRGTVTSMVIPPASTGAHVEAVLADGTGTVTLVWLGRDTIPGLAPGTRLRAEGVMTVAGVDRTLYNPRYEIEADET